MDKRNQSMALSRNGELSPQGGFHELTLDTWMIYFYFRDQRGVRRDSMSSWEQSLGMASETLGNLTGNHEPRNHRISIPTRAGGPVRG